MRRCATIAITAWLLLVVPAAPARAGRINPDNPPAGTFIDDWMIVRLNGVDAGWAHSTVTREGEVVSAATTLSLSIARAGQKIDIEATETSKETVAAEPISFASTTKFSAMESRMAGKIEGGKVVIETSQFGMTQKQTYDYPAGARMTWGLLAEQLRRGFEPGTEYDVLSYQPSVRADGAVTSHIAVKGKETIVLLDKPTEGIRVVLTLQSPMGSLEMISWVDGDGMVLKSELPFPGIGSLEMIRADEATARAAVGGGAEMFINTLIPASRPIDRQRARQIQYRLTLQGAETDRVPDVPVTAMQTPGKWTGRSIELRVGRIDRERFTNLAWEAPGKPMEEFLGPNVWINSDDPKIIAMAKQAAGDEKNPYRVCDRLRQHVTDVIRHKNLSVGFATASEVCRNLEGDCSEHSVLLAALGRAMGIPSRVVCGIVYVPAFEGSDNVFGFHMWTQFYLGGEWVDFDAAQRESDCNPTHIAFATSSLRDSSMSELAFALLKVLGQLKVEVLVIEPPDEAPGRPETAPASAPSDAPAVSRPAGR